MFESDDYDQILSEVDFSELDVKLPENTGKRNALQTDNFHKKTMQDKDLNINLLPPETSENSTKTYQNTSPQALKRKRSSISPENTRRTIINKYFDLNSERKFSEPAGLLRSNFEGENDDEDEMDIDYIENCSHREVFDSPPWQKLLRDTETLKEINNIKEIKHKALTDNLPGKKAQYVRAFIESVDKSNIDPLIALRDETGIIKCNLHRDAWKAFSEYIASECCAIVLRKPSVLTLGRPLQPKSHYLIITLNNILAIYSSEVENNDKLPDGYQKFNENDCTIIKMEGPDLSKMETVQNSIDDLDDVFLDMF